jgi:hypothetical protein
MTGQNFWTSTPIAPDSLGTACPLSGRNSTYRPVQILEAGWRRVARQEGVALGPSGVVTIPQVARACVVFLVRCTFTCVPPPQ